MTQLKLPQFAVSAPSVAQADPSVAQANILQANILQANIVQTNILQANSTSANRISANPALFNRVLSNPDDGETPRLAETAEEEPAKEEPVKEESVKEEQAEVLQRLRGALRSLESGRRRHAVREHARRLAKQEARAQQAVHQTQMSPSQSPLASRCAAASDYVNQPAVNQQHEVEQPEEAHRSLLEGPFLEGPFLEGWWCSSGWPELDAILPEQGWLRGSLIEWFSPGAGSGARLLALLAAVQACRLNSSAEASAGEFDRGRLAREGQLRQGDCRDDRIREARHPSTSSASANSASAKYSSLKHQSATDGDGVLVVLDRHRVFYPPAVLRWGLAPEQLVVLQPENAADERWALDQVLRSSGVAAVWAEVERLDERTFRRYQLAAERSGVVGMLMRPAACLQRPSWAELQLWVEPQPVVRNAKSLSRPAGSPSSVEETSLWQWQIELIRCRGGGAGRGVGQRASLTLDEQTGRFVSEQAVPERWGRQEVRVARTRQRKTGQAANALSSRAASSSSLRSIPPRSIPPCSIPPCSIPPGRGVAVPARATAVAAARMMSSREISDGPSQLPHALHLATQLADPKVGRRSARA